MCRRRRLSRLTQRRDACAILEVPFPAWSVIPPAEKDWSVITTERTFDVARPAAVVVEYLKDFANAVEWDPGTKTCVQEGAGPVAVGTTWHNVSEIKGRETELTYQLVTLEPGHITLVGKNKTATSTDDIRVLDAGPGTSTITYRSEIEFHGPAKLAQPFLKSEFDKLGDQTRDSITAAVARLP